ncbi:E-selectin-like [Strongylocentrotus purpuratus]|uniref:Sushi domain-containing protein n=1 Tax=Strongylocentrotus purpuratus TaxID=7668 RepID=A0A7M7PGU8_STRPU|nr:E-selectin-like [Strongylocentrotus purpuratus]
MTSQCNAALSIHYTESCSYSCDVGYSLVGSASVTCLANMSLSDFLPSCEVETCNVPQLPPNLSSSCTEGQNVAYNTTCEFSCNTGYDLIGMSSLDCLANRTFSDDIPTCQIVTCNIPAFPANLTMDNTQCGTEMMIDYNTSCMYECQPGYELVGNSFVICQASGVLSAELPTCEGMSI